VPVVVGSLGSYLPQPEQEDFQSQPYYRRRVRG
jgi:hypothetical protein